MARHLWSIGVFMLLTLIVACDANEPAVGISNEGGGEGATAEISEEAAASPESGDPIDFTEADLDLYERGFEKEIEIISAARERAMNASTPAERSAAMQAQWEDQSVPAAANAAGISEERYRLTRRAVHETFKTLDFQGEIDGPMQMDMSRASEETKARLAKDPFDALTPTAAAALRARMDRLVPVWIQYVKMTAVGG